MYDSSNGQKDLSSSILSHLHGSGLSWNGDGRKPFMCHSFEFRRNRYAFRTSRYMSNSRTSHGLL